MGIWQKLFTMGWRTLKGFKGSMNPLKLCAKDCVYV